MKMKYLVLLVFVTLFLIFTVTDNYGQTMPSVRVSVNKNAYKHGEIGTLTIKFNLAKKVKISVEPEIEVMLTSSDVEGLGLQPVTSEGGYLKSAKVKYKFKIPSNVAKGTTLNISGSVKFGYCNEDTGICKIGNKTFSKTIKVN